MEIDLFLDDWKSQESEQKKAPVFGLEFGVEKVVILERCLLSFTPLKMLRKLFQICAIIGDTIVPKV